MNWRRILVGGLAAGLVINVLDTATNFFIFGHQWGLAYDAIHLDPSGPALAGFWFVFNALLGLLVAWLYAVMRPRYGAGPGTAVRAALVPWLVLHGTLASHIVDGAFPTALLLETAACEVVSNILGALAAGRLYVEAEPAAAGR